MGSAVLTLRELNSKALPRKTQLVIRPNGFMTQCGGEERTDAHLTGKYEEPEIKNKVKLMRGDMSVMSEFQEGGGEN